jgi:transcriptional regulator with XRE-family HTH domain
MERALTINQQISARVRSLRRMSGMTQKELADRLGLTFQQIQKYEQGTNRISAGTLYTMAQHLDVPVSSLFPESDTPHPQPHWLQDPCFHHLRVLHGLPNPALRDTLLRLIELVAGEKERAG